MEEHDGCPWLEHLNQAHGNHPWADFAGQLDGNRVLIAVRTRLNWRKPRRRGVALTSYGFNGPGPRKAKLATGMFRLSKGLAENNRSGFSGSPSRLEWFSGN